MVSEVQPETRPADAVDDLEDRLVALRTALDRVQEEAQTLAPRAREALWHAQELSRLRAAGPGRAQALRERLGQLEQEIEGLRTAMESRSVIEQAKGMLMLRDRCDADTAFRTMVKVSQASHRKLRDVAAQVVEWGSSGQGRPE